MSLIRRSNRFFPAFSSIFDDFFNDELTRAELKSHDVKPAVNVKENKDNFEVDIAVPGVGKEDIEVEVKDDVLTVSSKKETKNEVVEDGKYVRKEFSFRSFRRMFTLPKSVDKNNIKAKYNDGVLNVNIPKSAANDNDDVKKIEIG